MDKQADDLVLQQLRKLREGAGLTADRLAQSGAVMSALGTADPEVGLQRLAAAVTAMGDSERARALKVDFGLGFEELVGRMPVVREREWLGDRRSAYAGAIGRDVKTLSRWSDRAVAELRGHLLSDSFNGHLYVVAAVEGQRIKGASLIQEPLEGTKDGITERSSLDIDNPSTEPSMPCLIYSYPRDWRPASLTLAVAFLSEPHPATIWGTYTDNIMKLAFGHERYVLNLNGNTATCRFLQPRTDLLYAIWWRDGAKNTVIDDADNRLPLGAE
ncbi:hypothetical protein [Parafrankia sp. BMG5.11]|uniref:hypothetical protein n=1 Tax=Parafrankia sp. BMG5.11 TaxID=222540 RepID=UPI001039750C|nr:hypothetical protein [Parafrankia sp. BMG5.11]TCJ35198.1 hypothetical protein E0504_29355 [Parafrankia sp. BMG5.11]